MPDDPIRKRLVARGHVQGVFFRDSTRRLAQEQGVNGWARNLPDGGVEVVLEGPPEGVAQVEQLCRSGPGESRVDRVETHQESPEGLKGFEIR
jgi:acylphosphatase